MKCRVDVWKNPCYVTVLIVVLDHSTEWHNSGFLRVITTNVFHSRKCLERYLSLYPGRTDGSAFEASYITQKRLEIDHICQLGANRKQWVGYQMGPSPIPTSLLTPKLEVGIPNFSIAVGGWSKFFNVLAGCEVMQWTIVHLSLNPKWVKRDRARYVWLYHHCGDDLGFATFRYYDKRAFSLLTPIL